MSHSSFPREAAAAQDAVGHRGRPSCRGSLSRRDLLWWLPGLMLAPRVVARAGAQPTSGVPVQRLHSFGVRVTDVERSLEFYQSLFGLAVQARQGNRAVLRLGDGPQYISFRALEAGERPAITHIGYSVDAFAIDRLQTALGRQGFARIDAPPRSSPGIDTPLKMWVRNRQDTPELFFADANGLVVQLEDPSSCGGTGPLGAGCTPVAAPTSGVLSLRDLSHFTVFVGDGAASNQFYQTLFGFGIQAYQGPNAPVMGVGDGIQFVMFAGGGGRGRGRGGGAPVPANIHHACMNMDGFDVDRVQAALESRGIQPRPEGSTATGPLMHYVSLRLPARGGAPGGTPELYFTDPDGLLMQIQDTSYCGGGGILGNECG